MLIKKFKMINYDNVDVFIYMLNKNNILISLKFSR